MCRLHRKINHIIPYLSSFYILAAKNWFVGFCFVSSLLICLKKRNRAAGVLLYSVNCTPPKPEETPPPPLLCRRRRGKKIERFVVVSKECESPIVWKIFSSSSRMSIYIRAAQKRNIIQIRQQRMRRRWCYTAESFKFCARGHHEAQEPIQDSPLTEKKKKGKWSGCAELFLLGIELHNKTTRRTATS